MAKIKGRMYREWSKFCGTHSLSIEISSNMELTKTSSLISGIHIRLLELLNLLAFS